MAKGPTLRECYAAGLTKAGWQPEDNRSRKYQTWAKDGVRERIFLGKAGSIRIGENRVLSVPLAGLTAERLLLSGRAVLTGEDTLAKF